MPHALPRDSAILLGFAIFVVAVIVTTIIVYGPNAHVGATSISQEANNTSRQSAQEGANSVTMQDAAAAGQVEAKKITFDPQRAVLGHREVNKILWCQNSAI